MFLLAELSHMTGTLHHQYLSDNGDFVFTDPIQ